jgi:hypothetical protein
MVVEDVIGVYDVGFWGDPFCLKSLVSVKMAFKVACALYGLPFICSMCWFEGGYTCDWCPYWDLGCDRSYLYVWGGD